MKTNENLGIDVEVTAVAKPIITSDAGLLYIHVKLELTDVSKVTF